MPRKGGVVAGLFGFFAGAQAKTVVYNATDDSVLLKLKAPLAVLETFSEKYLPNCGNITLVNNTGPFRNHSLWVRGETFPHGPFPLRGTFAKLYSMVGQASNSTVLKCVEKELSNMYKVGLNNQLLIVYVAAALLAIMLLATVCYCCLPKERKRFDRGEPFHDLPLDPMSAPLLAARKPRIAAGF